MNDTIRTKPTPEQYQKVIDMKPEERVRESDDKGRDRIRGILIAYSQKYDMRNGWIDFITTGDAIKEIEQLITDCGGDINSLK